jgi:uncharacterized protein
MSERPTQSHLFWGLAAIAIALVVCSLIAAKAALDVKRSADTISVTGSARKAITSDLVVWTGTLTSRGSNLQDAYATMQKYSKRVRAYLKEQKIPDDVVTFSAISTQEIKESRKAADSENTGETVTHFRIIGYELTQSFEIRTSQVAEITELPRKATDLIQEDIPLTSDPPQYLTTKLADLRVEMLEEATKDAKLRAEKIAKSAGSGIGSIRGARQGVFQITPRFSTEVSDYGVNDTTSLEKDITAVVSITFGID